MPMRYAVLPLLLAFMSVEVSASDKSSSPDTLEVARSIRLSDDLSKYESAFVKATTDLVASGHCTLREVEEHGGWVKSTTTYRNEPVYFVYCGGFTTANRIYLNAETGSIFK